MLQERNMACSGCSDCPNQFLGKIRAQNRSKVKQKMSGSQFLERLLAPLQYVQDHARHSTDQGSIEAPCLFGVPCQLRYSTRDVERAPEEYAQTAVRSIFTYYISRRKTPLAASGNSREHPPASPCVVLLQARGKGRPPSSSIVPQRPGASKRPTAPRI